MINDLETKDRIALLVRSGVGVNAIMYQFGMNRRDAHRIVDRVRQAIALEMEARDQALRSGKKAAPSFAGKIALWRR